MPIYPQPHYEKLKAVQGNDKLPDTDKPRVEAALKRYHKWIESMKKVQRGSDDAIERLTSLLNEYKLSIELDLIFDSSENWLYRSKGQTKLDNTILEEFIPWLVTKSLDTDCDIGALSFGPTTCFSAVYFESTLASHADGAAFRIRTKDQDFAIARKIFVKSSYFEDYSEADEHTSHLAFVAAEMKTNLDKTMFQEAARTAHDLRSAVAGSRYYLLCEWLDMTPISTASTDIDEVLILRKAKRLTSSVRKAFSTVEGRAAARDDFEAFLRDNPIDPDVLGRFVNHIKVLLGDENPEELDVLGTGHF